METEGVRSMRKIALRLDYLNLIAKVLDSVGAEFKSPFIIRLDKVKPQIIGKV